VGTFSHILVVLRLGAYREGAADDCQSRDDNPAHAAQENGHVGQDRGNGVRDCGSNVQLYTCNISWESDQTIGTKSINEC